MKKIPSVSIVIPALNEEKNLPRVMESLKKLDYPRGKWELIIVDGGSKDRTVEIARKFGAKVVLNKRQIRGAGCQAGVEKAWGEVIAFTDADCVVPRNWLKGLIKHLKEEKVVSVGGPNVTPKDDTDFAKAAGEVVWFLTRAGARYGFITNRVTETFHNPGCNVVYKKKAIVEAGGFNPNLLTCEDEELDFRIMEKGYKLLFTPEIVVDHYRRPTYKRIFVQSYRFAIGRVQAIKLHPGMARWFHFLPTAAVAGWCFAIIIGIVLPEGRGEAWGGSALGILALLGISAYLSVTFRHGTVGTYVGILAGWFCGWAIGFLLAGLGYDPKKG